MSTRYAVRSLILVCLAAVSLAAFAVVLHLAGGTAEPFVYGQF